MKFLSGIAIFLIIIMLSGCSVPKQPEQKNDQQRVEQVYFNPGLAKTIKKASKTVSGVRDSTAVVVNDEISVALKVTGLHRLRLNSIRKEVHDKIKNIAGNKEIHVTTDKKLFVQLQKLEKEINKQPKVEKILMILDKLNKINEDMKG